ncbi:type II toxin-antitoxin system VapC family toxin [Jiella sp. M17.18]|uniref:type II toxin-antitoxin system VapC family toxin n=1 Tax=Jiella sp. M17.18 TaxID=3234247 RepID=UPI0034E007AB
MSGFLLDTNVLSLLSPANLAGHAEFAAWLDRVDEAGRVLLSVVSVQEVEKAIDRLERGSATAKAAALRHWLAGLLATFQDKILPIDVDVAIVAGRLESAALAAGHDPGMADALIGGTAKAHGLTVLTRNTRHFLPFAIDVVSPEYAISLPV